MSSDTADPSCPFDPAAGLAHVDSVLSELKYSIDIMGRHRRISKTAIESFTGYRLYLTDDAWTTYVQDGAENAHRIYGMARAVEQSLADLAAAEARVLTSIEHLEPWTQLRVPVEQATPAKYVGLALGTAESRSYEAALADAAEAVEGLSWEVVASEKDKVRLMVAYPMSAADDAIRALAQAGFTKVSFEQYSGVPSDIIARLEQEFQSIQAQRAQIERDIDILVEERPRAFALYDSFALERARLDVTNRFGGTERTFIVEGWVQLRNLQEFRTAIEKLADDIVVLDRPPHDDEEPPVELENNRFARLSNRHQDDGLSEAGLAGPQPVSGSVLPDILRAVHDRCRAWHRYRCPSILAHRLTPRPRHGPAIPQPADHERAGHGVCRRNVGRLGGRPSPRLFGWYGYLVRPDGGTHQVPSFSHSRSELFRSTQVSSSRHTITSGRDWLSAIFDQVFWLVSHEHRPSAGRQVPVPMGRPLRRQGRNCCSRPQ